MDTTIVTKYFETNRDIVRAYFSYLEKSVQLVENRIPAMESREYLIKLLESSRDITLEAIQSQGSYLECLLDSPRYGQPPDTEYFTPILPEQAIRKPAMEQAIQEFASKQAGDDSSWIKETLSEMTGFPEDMLGRNTRFEEDLGIHSIDRVDLMAKIIEKYPQLEKGQNGVEIFETIGELEAYIASISAKNEDADPKARQFCENGEGKEPDLMAWFRREICATTGFPQDCITEDTRFQEDLGLNSIDLISINSKLITQFPEFGDILERHTVFSTPQEAIRFLKDQKAALKKVEPDGIENKPDKDRIKRFVFTEEVVENITEAIPHDRNVLIAGEPSKNFTLIRDGFIDQGIHAKELYLEEKKWVMEDSQYRVDIGDIPGLNKMLRAVLNLNELPLTILYLAAGDGNPLDTEDRQLWEKQVEHAPVGLFALTQAVFFAGTKRNPDLKIGIVGVAGNSAAWAGARGVARSLAHDWPEIEIRSMWVKDASMKKIADRIPGVLQNLPKGQDFSLEDQRVLDKKLLCQTLNKTSTPRVKADARSIFLLAGGGDGITAECGYKLAEKFKCTIIALGRTPKPSCRPYADISEGEALKCRIVEDLRGKAEKAVCGEEIEKQKQILLRQRSIWDTGEKIRSLGASFDYYSVDVTDYAALTSVMDQIHHEHGLISGLIHGAGIVGRQRVKTVDSFRKVLYTKAASAYYFYQLLKNDPLQFAVMFSSIASYTGGPNLCDYSAANEILNEIAQDWNRRVDYPVKSILWSFWSETGLAKSMANSGLVGIKSKDGVRILLEELLYGKKTEDKIVYINESVLEYSINPVLDKPILRCVAAASEK